MPMPKLKKIGRYAACILFVLVFFLSYEARLIQWQIVDGEKYEQISLSSRTDAMELDAARGQILDRNGQVLAGNRTSFNIVYNALYMDYSQRNATIIKVIDLLEEQGEKWRDNLPIVLDEEGNYQFAEDKENEIASLKGPDMLNLADYATADECMAELAETFDCQGYSTEDTRNVASVRYSMRKDGYSRTNPYVIAEDVSAETVGVVSQRENEWPGIEVRVAVTRYYGEDGALAPHVLGFVGQISDTQYQEMVEKGKAYDAEKNISGYTWTDTLGKAGLEEAFESELRGSRGEETIFTDETGEVKSTAVTIQPKEGNTVYTTLDTDLQRAANISLKKNIEGNTLAKDCIAGAAVVLDVKDFGVLACSSYPTYDLNRYTSSDNYLTQLSDDKEKKPLFNRALNGVFVPGSVFKPMVALAALQEGVVGADTTFFCNRLFKYGEDMQLKCTDYHADANVYSALAGSCNVYFCNVGLKLTIKKMDAYAEYFGLGQKTGIEIYEDTGVMANPQEYQRVYGTPWPDGVSAQAAIGQADSRFTPMQLATYCATIANGGVRLQTHFLDKVTDYTGKDIVKRHQKKEMMNAGLSSDVLGVVRQGMMQVGSYGTAKDVFSEYPVAVACKTGTAETSDTPDGTEANLSFICYAPAEDPEIAVAVMLEYGNKGAYAQNVAKDILDQYFGFYTWDEEGNRYDGSTGDMVDDQGKVLKTKEELDREKQLEEALKAQPSSSGEEGEETSRDTVSSQPSRGDGIPDAPFTGESSPETSEPAADSSQGSGGEEGAGNTPADSPYYEGSG